MCTRCLAEGDISASLSLSEVNDDNFYIFTCSKGHLTTLSSQHPKFNILFELGVSNFAEKNYREVIFNIHSALESFYNYAIELICVDILKNPIAFDASKKHAKKYSERLFGAFIFLWNMNIQTPIEKIDDKFTKIRNEITHNGLIPTQEITLEYLTAIAKWLVECMAVLERDNNEEQIQFVFRQLSNSRMKPQKEHFHATSCERLFLKELLYNPSKFQNLRYELEEHCKTTQLLDNIFSNLSNFIPPTPPSQN